MSRWQFKSYQPILGLRYFVSVQSRTLALVAIASSLLAIAAQPAMAQSKLMPLKADPSSTTVNRPSQSGLTVPSLWWAAEQFGDKLLVNWSTYPTTKTNPQRVQIVVRREIWRLLDYVERYAFTNHFGTVARDYGYNVQVVDRERNSLAAYTCDFSRANPRLLTRIQDTQKPIPNYAFPRSFSKPACQLQLNPSIL